MGQLEFDLRLDYERSLKENLIAVAKFAGEQMKKDLAVQAAVDFLVAESKLV